MAVTTDHHHPIDPERVAHARSRLPSADDAARLTGLLSMMADPVRLRVVERGSYLRHSPDLSWSTPPVDRNERPVGVQSPAERR